MLISTLLASFCSVSLPLVAAVGSQPYTWKNVKIGGGGGFIPGIIFNPSQQGLAYARTDIGGVYRLNSDDSWTPLLDWADNAQWDFWGTDALASDPVEPSNVYVAVGMYTNSWDPSNGSILKSTNYGANWTVAAALPFKVGGNMPGRGMGERLAVDPNDNSILYFGARSGHGLWKSTNGGSTWTNVTAFPSVGTYIEDPSDTTGYESDIDGIAWVTFDSTSGTSGQATPRVFVGVANMGSNSVFVTEDAGNTWSAVAGQNSTFIPHRGVLSPADKMLYVTYANGAGPYDGTLGSVYSYNITSGVWTAITPWTDDLYFGFGGLAVDYLNPGTIMVATVNSWWPDGNIFRTTDYGATWSPLWAWVSYPTLARYYAYDDSLAPWLSTTETGPTNAAGTADTKQIGWMLEAMAIDPFDSNHWLYGTGETMYGGHDLLKWDTIHNVTLASLADGIEECSVEAVLSPPTGPPLISAVGDDGGFVHNDVDVAPSAFFTNPTWSTTVDLDYAGNDPTNIVRIGNGDDSTGLQVALSTNSGATWNQDYGAAANVTGGKVALSANGDIVLWSSSSNGVLVSQYTNAFTAVTTLPAGSLVASDKLNDTTFYAVSGSKFYLSTNNGVSFAVTSGSLGSTTAPVNVIVNPRVSGDVWVSSDAGLFHSTNFGSTFTAVTGVTQAWAIGLGAPATTGGYPAIFAGANIGGLVAYYRSDNEGQTWVQINDAAHGFGSASSNVLTGDPRIYGRVYIGTNGRGIFYGDIAGSATVGPSTTASYSTPTVTPTTTPTTSSTHSSAPTTSSTPKTTSTSTKASTTTTSHTSSTPKTTTSTSSAPASTNTAGAYGQCGGIGWTGATACASGFVCTMQNAYYSQCIPT